MLHENVFQIINMYSITGKNRTSDFCDTSYSRSGVNQMWILKNSKDLYIQSRSLSSCNSIKTSVVFTYRFDRLKPGASSSVGGEGAPIKVHNFFDIVNLS